MKRILVVGISLFLLTTPLILAQGGYKISWWSIDNGGGISTGGKYTLLGTMGQSDAAQLSGGNYNLDSGYQVPQMEENYVYLPIIVTFVQMQAKVPKTA